MSAASSPLSAFSTPEKLTWSLQILRRRLVLDLSIAGGLGTTFGYLWWYGYHLPRVRARDNYYIKIEDERARAAGFK
ncbi:hypothetical protein DV737_g863, partial [Chaetothyriales sp. CBS 132003]